MVWQLRGGFPFPLGCKSKSKPPIQTHQFFGLSDKGYARGKHEKRRKTLGHISLPSACDLWLTGLRGSSFKGKQLGSKPEGGLETEHADWTCCQSYIAARRHVSIYIYIYHLFIFYLFIYIHIDISISVNSLTLCLPSEPPAEGTGVGSEVIGIHGDFFVTGEHARKHEE